VPITDALSVAHGAGIAHRDLTPGNVMVSDDDRVKVLDFGLAKLCEVDTQPVGPESTLQTLTQAGGLMGTVPYMSPEQVQGLPVDHRTDIFSFGIVLYEMATGRRPFRGDTGAYLMSSILRDEPTPLAEARDDLPRHLGRIVRRCLEKEPGRRYQTAADLRDDLADLRRELSDGQSAAARSSPSVAAPRAEEAPARKTYRTPFVGRDAERTEILRLVELAEQGRGGLLLIGGEPGVGRTRLAEELWQDARERGCLSLLGHCYEMEGTPPFIPWVEILEYTSRIAPRDALRELLGDAAPEVAKLVPELHRLFPDIPKPLALPPDQARRYLFNSFQEFLERSSGVQPLFLVIEDLQWADESTLLLLQHLAQHVREERILIVGTYRDVDLDPDQPLSKALRELVRERLAQRLSLKRLGREHVAEILEGLGGQPPPQSLVQVIVEKTDGNPFFIEEIYQHLEEDGKLFDGSGAWRTNLSAQELEVPEGVRLVVGRRLERLSDEGRKVLTAAAVVGRRFGFELLEAIVDLDPDLLLDTMEEAERLHIIRPISDSHSRDVLFTFPHELIRQTLASGLSVLRRQRLHKRIAEAMETLYAGDLERHATALAHHLHQAGAAAPRDKTLRYLSLAGHKAMQSAAFEDALRHFDNALVLVPADDRKARADLLFRRGWSLRSLARWAEARDDWHEALPIYEEIGDTRAAVRICRGLSFSYLWSYQPEEGIRVAERAMRLVGEEPSPDRFRLLASAGLNHTEMGDFEAAESAFREAVAGAEALDSEPLLGEVLGFKASHHLIFMQPREAVATGQRAVELLRESGDLWQMTASMGFVQQQLIALGRVGEARELNRELEPLAERLGHLGARVILERSRGTMALALDGDFDAFGRSGQRLLELLRLQGRSSSSSHTIAALHDFWKGRWEEASASFERAAADEHADWTAGGDWGHHFRFRAYAGEKQAALASYEERKEDLPVAGQVNTAGRWAMLPGLVEGLLILDELGAAAELYPLVLSALDSGSITGYHPWGLFQTVAGMAAAAGGRWQEAEEHYRTALEQADRTPYLVEQPEVRRWYARMLIERGEGSDAQLARELLTRSLEQYRALDMPKHAVMAEALLGQL
jgi:tetratricopeptide (TPR) repeat protein